jgi:hypothetical protein
VGAVLLLISLWLNWFKPIDGQDLTGWTSFEVLDLVLAALALLALAAAAERFGYATPAPARALPAIGSAGFIIVVSQLLNHPPVGQGRPTDVGIWLALGAAALIAGGGLLGRARISLEVVVERNSDPDRDSVTTEVESSARAEAAAEEPKVERELYPKNGGDGPIGADDPEPFRSGPEDETRRID